MNRYNALLLEAILVLIFTLVAIASTAQSQQTIDNQLLFAKVQRMSDSVDHPHLQGRPRYRGYEISLAFPQYQLKSDISQLNSLCVSFTGAGIGGMIGNQKGKIKAGLGLYYSNSSVPYEIDLLAASVTSNVYLLRVKDPVYHTIEPYAIAGIQQQMSRFFGNYLDNKTTVNYSFADAPLLGNINATQLVLGAGLEYQLENDHHQFIHFFTEFTYGRVVNNISSNASFSLTSDVNPILISVGVNFGIVK